MSVDVNLTGKLFRQLRFAEALIFAGDETAITIFGSGAARCANSGCSFVVPSGAQFVTAGSVAPLPFPASGLILLRAAAGIGALRRRS